MRRQPILLGAAILTVVAFVVALAAIGVYRGRYYASLQWYYTLRCMGHAGILFQARHGKPPGSIEELVATGILRRKGEYVDIGSGVHGWRTLYVDAAEVLLAFPEQVKPYELRNGLLFNTDAQEVHLLVDVAPPAAWEQHVQLANRAISPDWLTMMERGTLPNFLEDVSP